MQSFPNGGGPVCDINWNGLWGHISHTAPSDLHKETWVITNRCHITFSIKVIKWVEIPKDEVIEVCARGYVAQLPAVSGEWELCTGNELWPSEFSLIIASLIKLTLHVWPSAFGSCGEQPHGCVWQWVPRGAVELGTHRETGQDAAGHGHVAVKMALGNSCCCWTERGKINVHPGGD